MKRTLTVLAAVAVLAAGCGGDDDEPTPEPTSAAPVKAIPSPSPDEAQALTAELERIVPGVSVDREKAIDAARGTCESILGGAENVEQATITRFTVGLDVDEVTTDQAGQIVALVESQGWCTSA